MPSFLIAFKVLKISSDSNKFEILEIPTACEANSIDRIEILLSELTLIFLLKLLILFFIKIWFGTNELIYFEFITKIC